MPFYRKLGEIPHKRHTQFRKPDGALYREEVMGLEGFSGIQSILYHHFLPPRVLRVEDLGAVTPTYTDFGPIRHRAFSTAHIPSGGDPVQARRVLLGNRDVTLGVARPTQSMDYFYRNAQAYELWFVHEGSGVLRTQFGSLAFGAGDYLVIPFGVTWQMQLAGEARFFVIEAPSQIEPPRRYRNKYGQLLEHSPYCERDIRTPEQLETFTERGEFEVRVKVRDRLTRHVWIIIRLMWSAGMAIYILGRSAFTILSRSRAESISRRQSIRRLKAITSWSVRSCRACSTIIRKAYRRRTITATSTATKCSTTPKAISCRGAALRVRISRCILAACRTDRSPALPKPASAL
jgi:mannose-6-phosphate isomerase-like protein (cupin superfamily)